MLKGMLEKKIKKKKDAYPKKVCHMPTRHVQKKREKDSPHPWKINKREGLCKADRPPFTKNSHTLAHLNKIV